MVGRNIQKNSNICAEIVHIVQLERAKFDDIPFVFSLGHLQRKALTNVASQAYIVARLLQDVVDERRGSGLSI